MGMYYGGRDPSAYGRKASAIEGWELEAPPSPPLADTEDEVVSGEELQVAG
jgi:hypothetical protein